MKTIKFFILSLIFLSGVGLVNAQKISFGVQAGSNFAVQSQIGDYFNNEDIRVGLHAGVFTKYNISDKVSLQAEINYDELGSKSKTVKNNFDYLNIPVLFNYSVGKSDLTALNFDLYAGPYAGFLLKAESTLKDSETDQTTDLKDNTNNITGGVIIGFGLRYPINNQKILLDFRLGLGLTPYDKNDYVPKNKYFGISLGYEF
jgi:hypothetical protein